MRAYKDNGFTLLELMISIAIFGVLSALMFGGLNSTLLISDKVTEKTQNIREVERAFSIIKKDFALDLIEISSNTREEVRIMVENTLPAYMRNSNTIIVRYYTEDDVFYRHADYGADFNSESVPLIRDVRETEIEVNNGTKVRKNKSEIDYRYVVITIKHKSLGELKRVFKTI